MVIGWVPSDVMIDDLFSELFFISLKTKSMGISLPFSDTNQFVKSTIVIQINLSRFYIIMHQDDRNQSIAQLNHIISRLYYIEIFSYFSYLVGMVQYYCSHLVFKILTSYVVSVDNIHQHLQIYGSSVRIQILYYIQLVITNAISNRFVLLVKHESFLQYLEWYNIIIYLVFILA